MKLSECEIGDIVKSARRTMEFCGKTSDNKFVFKVIESTYIDESSGNMVIFPFDTAIFELVSRKSNDEKYYEIESLKMQLKNIQKRIDKLEEETYFEIGSIYEINYHGNIIKGCLVEILNESYRFITNSTAVYNIEKNSNSKFKKFPDESVKNFFRKDSK